MIELKSSFPPEEEAIVRKQKDFEKKQKQMFRRMFKPIKQSLTFKQDMTKCKISQEKGPNQVMGTKKTRMDLMQLNVEFDSDADEEGAKLFRSKTDPSGLQDVKGFVPTGVGNSNIHRAQTTAMLKQYKLDKELEKKQA